MRTCDEATLAYYTRPGVMTSAGRGTAGTDRGARQPPAGRRAAAEARLPGNCRHFTVVLTAMLRAHGTPARARCGFGGYFGTGAFEDHWVCEYWHAGQRRWRLADAQVDAVQRGWFDIGFDLTDVPRDQFLIAADAWARSRAGCATTSGSASRRRSATPSGIASSGS